MKLSKNMDNMDNIVSQISSDNVSKRLSDNEFMMVNDCMNAVLSSECEDWMKKFDEDSGFMWSHHENIKKISDKMEFGGHSGASFACTMRTCQFYLKNQDEWKKELNFHTNSNK